jgi:peptidoglycan LD-endopeptidase LytH
VSRHGKGPSRRAVWILSALGVVLLAVVGVAVVIGRSSPVSTPTGANLPSLNGIAPSTAPPTTPPAVPTTAPTTAPPPPAKPAATKYVFPVVSSKASYAHTHHDYPASDIISPCGSPVVAVTTGVILEVGRTDTWNAKTDLGADRGGLFFSLLGDDGVRYYGSHLRSVNAGIDPGVRVSAGQNIAVVGDTGDASACHLHFGLSPVCARTGDWWTRRGVIWPWSYLDAWRKGTMTSPLPEITTWQKAHGCPTTPTTDP